MHIDENVGRDLNLMDVEQLVQIEYYVM